MDYSKKQTELDIQKWIDSETKTYDTCGEYSYCCKCNKSESYPCACAWEKFYGSLNSDNAYQTKTATSTTKTTKRTCTRKTTSSKTSTTKSKTPSTKKTTTRKTTSTSKATA